MKQIDLRDAIAKRRTFGFLDDFDWYITPHRWTSLASDGGSSVGITANAAGGILALITGATDNNKAAVSTTNAIFKFATDKPVLFEANVQYTEAATSAANVAVGMADAWGANLLVDDGAGPKTSFSGFLIYKVDGGTVWKCVSSKSTTQTINTSTVTAGGATAQALRIEGRLSAGGSSLEVSFFVDNAILLDTTTKKPIKHNVTITSAVAMQAGAYVKAGSANSETLSVDYVASYQLR